jgi:hypothetical protein
MKSVSLGIINMRMEKLMGKQTGLSQTLISQSIILCNSVFSLWSLSHHHTIIMVVTHHIPYIINL